MATGKDARTPTIHDVAARAGVSATTVSRTFGRPGRVSFETAQRVRQAARELGYRYPRASRAGDEDRARTGVIAVIVSDLSPAFHELVRGAEDAAAKADHVVIVVDSREDDLEERRVIRRLLPFVDAVFLSSTRLPDEAIRTIAKQKPTMVANRIVRGVPCILPNVPRLADQIVTHLERTGRRTVTYAAGPEASWSDGARWRLLHDSAAGRLTVRRSGPYAPTSTGGADAADHWLTHRTDAVVLFNDLMALGFVSRVRAAGVGVPQDVAVVGFDDVEGALGLPPTLTTGAASLRALGAIGTQNLIAIAGGATPRTGEPIVVPAELLLRATA